MGKARLCSSVKTQSLSYGSLHLTGRTGGSDRYFYPMGLSDPVCFPGGPSGMGWLRREGSSFLPTPPSLEMERRGESQELSLRRRLTWARSANPLLHPSCETSRLPSHQYAHSPRPRHRGVKWGDVWTGFGLYCPSCSYTRAFGWCCTAYGGFSQTKMLL